MKDLMRFAPVALLLLVGCPPPILVMREPDDPGRINARFACLVDSYLHWYFSSHPTAATAAGIHEYDSCLGDYSADRVRRRVDTLRYFLNEIGRFYPESLSHDHRLDRAAMVMNIHWNLLWYDKLRVWERDPGFYGAIIAQGLCPLTAFDSAPAEARLRAVVRRLLEVPQLLQCARENVKDPALPHVQAAREDLRSLANFLRESLPAAFETVEDKGELEGALRRAVEAVENYAANLAAAHDNFAAGPEAVAAVLSVMVDGTYPSLTFEHVGRFGDQARAWLGATQAELKLLAVNLDGIRRDQWLADSLVVDTAEMLTGLRRLARERVIEIPDGDCVVQEAPPSPLTGPLASLWTPGALEPGPPRGFCRIMPADGARNRHSLALDLCHEVYPGRFTHWLYVRQVPSKIRRIANNPAVSEGWAHWTERLLARECLDGDPRLRVVQLQRQRLSVCRYLAAVEMHSGRMSLREAVELFVREAGQEPSDAEREACRVARDPFVLGEALGARYLAALYERAAGDLHEFSRNLLQLGYAPLSVLGEELAGPSARKAWDLAAAPY